MIDTFDKQVVVNGAHENNHGQALTWGIESASTNTASTMILNFLQSGNIFLSVRIKGLVL